MLSTCLLAFIFVNLVTFSQAQNIEPRSQAQNAKPRPWVSRIFAEGMWHYTPSSKHNQECTRQGEVYRHQLREGKLWSVRMQDSSVISPTGLVDGNFFHLAHADECIQTDIPIDNFHTQYCLPTGVFTPKSEQLYPEFFSREGVDLPYDMNKTVWDFIRPRPHNIRGDRLSFSWGVCVPAACSTEDIRSSLESTLDAAFSQYNMTFSVDLPSNMCYSGKEMETRQMPLAGKLWVWTFYLLVILMIAGTTVDYQLRANHQRVQGRNNPLASFLLAFSVISNSERLCALGPKADGEVSIIHGCKYFAMMGTVFFHRHYLDWEVASNTAYVEKAIHNPNFFLMTASSQLLDTFFFLAGFLLSQSLNKKNVRGMGQPGTLSVIIYRIIRLYPALLAAMAFSTWVFPYMGEGPRWKYGADGEAQACQQNWWLNLLFISTFFSHNDLCVLPSWFLSTEFQLFLIGITLIVLVEKYPSRRTVILSSALIISNIVPSVVIYLNNAPSLFLMNMYSLRHLHMDPYMRNYYVKFYMRSLPYIFGICSGYWIPVLVKRKFKMTGLQKVFLFFFSVIQTLVTFYIGALFMLPSVEFNVWHHVIFAAVMRLAYAFALFSLLLVHMCDGVGAVTKFLNLPLFIPLGRITFHMLFIHYFVIEGDIFTQGSAPHVTVYNLLLRYCGDLFLTTLLATMSTLLFESPIGILKNKILKPNLLRSSPTSSQQNGLKKQS